MTEKKFKGIVFAFIFISKFAAILFLLFHWSTGGFSPEEFASAVTQVLPLFTIYSSIMFQEAMKNKYASKDKKKSKVLSKSYVWIGITVLSIYGIVILLFINWKAAGTLSFAQMGAWLAGLESGMGVYVGTIIYSLFPKTEAEK